MRKLIENDKWVFIPLDSESELVRVRPNGVGSAVANIIYSEIFSKVLPDPLIRITLVLEVERCARENRSIRLAAG
jgi:hypothetical protein